MRFIRIIGGAALAAMTAAAGTGRPAVAAAQPADFAAQAAALVDAAYPADGPGGAVVVMRGGRVLYAGGRGMADIDAKRAITPDTPFRIGSIAKQFTAAVVLQLVAEGRLSLDDSVARFFPEWPQPGAGATVRQLLNHSSGIQDYTKLVGWMGTEQTARPFTTAELIEVIRSRPSPSAPGARWEYNNSGYALLGAIVEKVTGEPWHQAIVERIARPLGLTTLAYADAAPTAARPYAIAGGRPQPARGAHMSVAHAAGGLVASARDLAAWAQALHHGRVVSPALYAEMTSPSRLADGSVQTYGFALRQREIRGRPALVHGGAGRGIDTDSAYVPSADLYVAVLTNSDDLPIDSSILVRRLAALALGEPVPVFTRTDVDIAAIEPLFGLYPADRGPPRRFFARDGKLHFGRGDEEMQVFAAGGDRFFFGPDDLAWFRIERRPDGAHRLEVHRIEAAAPDRSVRAGPVPPPLEIAPAVLRSYVGSYATEGPVLTVTLADGRLSIGPPGQAPGPMRPVSETEFRVEGSPNRVVFHPEGGKVERITVHRGARALNGKRVAQ